ncbi:biotin/lipoyl-binding protein [Hyphomicrobium sp. NDB2Meth4]|uniref:HlyD family secretion protein n=1 Tax=Hyphomicrobium sp. NDB2Meth4 TaxID=1892846 RepID=UPI0009303E2D|nr:biotin/lipoyl-binding protein [Hyphomicrobium sp. NDB2Meth4]
MKRLRSKANSKPVNLGGDWRSGQWTRRIYLAILAAIGLVALNYFVGDAVILHADGMVVRDRYEVAATFPAKVSSVYVQQGDIVREGQVLAKLESAEILKDIAQLSVQFADVSTRDAQLEIRAATTQALMPLAARHAEESANAVKRYDTMKALIPTNRKDEALGSEYLTAERLAGLQNESRIITQQLPLIAAAQERAKTALSQLDAFYDGGNIKAPVEGVLGSKVPVPGQVVKFGDALFDLYGTHAEVLAYLPDMYLFPIEVGDKVQVTGGRTSTIGEISAILPVTEALPPEFQNTFRPRDRGQLVRIELPAQNNFAIAQKIDVSGCIAGWCWASDGEKQQSLFSRLWSTFSS